jgi:putative SOS response-associated peptidase YedK
MCNRYRVSPKQLELAKQYGFDISKLHPEPERLPPPELFPRKPAWVFRKEDGERLVDVMQWGVPLATKTKTGKPSKKWVTNVRNLTSPFWRSMLNRPSQRCLIPAAEFCEWSGEAGSKTTHWFGVRDSEMFCFAGIWRPTEDGNAFAFLTCDYLGDPSSHIVGAIHPKAMTVIVEPADYDRWLDGDVGEACSLVAPYPSQLMRAA